MKAVTFRAPMQVAVEEIENPKIETSTDCIVRMTSAAICGSDLHMYEGRTAAKPGVVFGHEPMGIVEEVGAGVQSIAVGDRVVLPFNIACGFCRNCVRGFWSTCLTTNPDGAGAAYGYVGMGPYHGAQAEFLRVPFADVNCLKLPGTEGDEFEHHFLMLADVLPTGFHAAKLANVEPGSTVAIWGAGPVGLMAAISAQVLGAAEVYVVDHVAERLQLAKDFGAIPIDATKAKPVEQIRELRASNRATRESLRPGEEKMDGVMCGIDAVGYQARSHEQPGDEKQTQAIEDLAELVNPSGSIGLIGVYLAEDPGAGGMHAQHGEFVLPLGTIWKKGISVGMGQAPVKRYNAALRDLIIAGAIEPGRIVSKEIGFDEIPDAYQRFDRREPGYTKVILRPGKAMEVRGVSTHAAEEVAAAAGSR
jgi:glutathione-independent formaldehyde dehydrogenase